jgi:hypothetical protein
VGDIFCLLDDCFEELSKDAEFGIEGVDGVSSNCDERSVASAVYSSAGTERMVLGAAVSFSGRRWRNCADCVLSVGDFGAAASGNELERGSQNRRGARIGAHGALPDGAASDLYGDAGDVCGNSDCVEPISRAAGIGDIVGRISAEDAAGGEYFAANIWRGMGFVPARDVAAGAAAVLIESRSEMSGAVLFAAAFGDPAKKAAHAGPLCPHQTKKLAGVEISGGGTEKCFHAPAKIRAFPRLKTVAFGSDPVIAKGIQHASL